MFYFLIYQSSIAEYYNTEKKYLTSFFWGTISYIITHACLSSSTSPIMIQLKKSFWLFFLIDVGVLFYMHTYINSKTAESDDSIVDDLLKKMSLSSSSIDKNIEGNSHSDDDTDSIDDEKINTNPDSVKSNQSNQSNQSNKSLKQLKQTQPLQHPDEHSQNLIISPDNHNNLKRPQTLEISSSGKSSTPISQLESDDENDVQFNDDDSGSDIDIDQFEEYLTNQK